jgi:iron complex outermembrane receptor protein
VFVITGEDIRRRGAITLPEALRLALRSVRPEGNTAELRNDIEGHSRGLEAWITWCGSERWRLTAGGTLLDQPLRVKEGQVDFGGMAALGNDPRHWWPLRSSFDLTRKLAWTPWPDIEAVLVLRNLTAPRHPEWDAAAARTEFGRSAALQLRWRL